MLLDFRIDWGYSYLYSRRHYHPQFIWDGFLTCDGGRILKTFQLDYPYIWFGPGHSAHETPLPAPEWKSSTKRGFAGVRFEAEVTAQTVFHLKTVSFEADFTAKEVQDKGRLEFPVGPKYLNCSVIVTKTGYYWFRQPLLPGETEIAADTLGLPLHDWSRMKLAWLACGKSADFTVTVPEPMKDHAETLLHIVAMGVPPYTSEKETQVRGYIPLALLCDGVSLGTFRRWYRAHDTYMQLLEDNWIRVPLPAGAHTLTLCNRSDALCLGIFRITAKPCEYDHGQLSVPEWMLRSERLTAKVYAVRPETIPVRVGGDIVPVDCVPGWNEFPVAAGKTGDLCLSTPADEKRIEVYDAQEEDPPVKVGYDMTTVPNDDSGCMDWLLDYTQRTRLGNYILFRDCAGFPEVAPALQARWGEFCRTHGIYAAACTHFYDGSLSAAAGDHAHDFGRHEYSGVVYGADPEPPYASATMKEATEKFQAYMKSEIDRTLAHNPAAAFGDASGAIRHSFLMGAAYTRAETMVGNTQTLLSQARPACEALGGRGWGVHIAIQHNFQPYHETHLGQYFLSLFQPWMMGAEFIYEEDSLFLLFKEERQSWDDLCTKGKRDMTRRFFKFVKTHPRQGQNLRRIAFLEGRWAAPFNGFICGTEQDPHYAVWGRFGNPAPEWGHGQPEKCRALLDVLMPGACTHPFRQRYDKRRFFFAGTPYGDFDCIPAEAGSDYWNRYALLLNLGWNTLIEEDYAKMKRFAAEGGTLLTGLPQFSLHEDRAFLRDMDDLALMNGGDLSELCGLRVRGRGVPYCGQWVAADGADTCEPTLSAMPSDSPLEDGEGILADVELCGAEVLAWDSFSGKPMLVRCRYGKGWVYTFTLWAYPGHEQFQRFAAAWVQRLARENRGETFVEDPSGEVFWTLWQDGPETTLMLLNTDWTRKGNVKPVRVVHEGADFPLEITERTAVLVRFGKEGHEVSVYTL